MRGEVWDARIPRAGKHPVVVLSINLMIGRLGSVSVVLVTGTVGPEETHIPLDTDSGLTGHPQSYANATDLHTIPKASLATKRGRLDRAELRRLEDAVRICLGL